MPGMGPARPRSVDRLPRRPEWESRTMSPERLSRLILVLTPFFLALAAWLLVRWIQGL